jgi:hypothetical protein
MASEDSRQHVFQRSRASLPLPPGVHLVSETNDPSETVRVVMLAAVHGIEDLLESLEGARLATERDDVPLEERYDLLAKSRGRRDLVHEDSRAPALGSNTSAGEGQLRELEYPSAALVLIQEEAWINVIPGTTRRVTLDAHTQGTLALDEAR